MFRTSFFLFSSLFLSVREFFVYLVLISEEILFATLHKRQHTFIKSVRLLIMQRLRIWIYSHNEIKKADQIK